MAEYDEISPTTGQPKGGDKVSKSDLNIPAGHPGVQMYDAKLGGRPTDGRVLSFDEEFTPEGPLGEHLYEEQFADQAVTPSFHLVLGKGQTPEPSFFVRRNEAIKAYREKKAAAE
ncbi:MAG: hypothetical protein NVS3B1_21390 [Marmoricola sp.]